MQAVGGGDQITHAAAVTGPVARGKTQEPSALLLLLHRALSGMLPIWRNFRETGRVPQLQDCPSFSQPSCGVAWPVSGTLDHPQHCSFCFNPVLGMLHSLVSKASTAWPFAPLSTHNGAEMRSLRQGVLVGTCQAEEVPASLATSSGIRKCLLLVGMWIPLLKGTCHPPLWAAGRPAVAGSPLTSA